VIQLGLNTEDVDALKGAFTIPIPIRTTTGLNFRESWFVRSKRVKRERKATRWFWIKAKPPPFILPLRITLIRISPGNKADLDNVVGGLKGVRDQVAEQLGFDDGDPRISWRYGQLKGPWGVTVTIEDLK
jgi:hypothetical protein